MSDEILVNNGKRTMTLDELARSMPGMDRLMVEIGHRASCLYHAAKAGNWPLAGYFCRTLGKHQGRPLHLTGVDSCRSTTHRYARRSAPRTGLPSTRRGRILSTG